MRIVIPMDSRNAYIVSLVVVVAVCCLWMVMSDLWHKHKMKAIKEMGTKATARQMMGNIPVENVLDKTILRNSLEQQEFVPLDTYLWESKDWIRIWNKFFPKNVIVGMEVYGRDSEWLEVRTIMGKSYTIKGEKDFFLLRQQAERLGVLFPFSRILYETDMTPFSYGDREKERQQLKKAYGEYIKTHTVEELITKSELAEQCAETYCLERFGNSRKLLEKHRKRTADERARTYLPEKKEASPRRRTRKISWGYYIFVWASVLILFGIGPLLSLGKRLTTDKVVARVVAAENWDAQSHRNSRYSHTHFMQDLTFSYEWNGQEYNLRYEQAEIPFQGYKAGDAILIFVDKENGEIRYTAKELDVTVNVIILLLWGVGFPALCFLPRKRKK